MMMEIKRWINDFISTPLGDLFLVHKLNTYHIPLHYSDALLVIVFFIFSLFLSVVLTLALFKTNLKMKMERQCEKTNGEYRERMNRAYYELENKYIKYNQIYYDSFSSKEKKLNEQMEKQRQVEEHQREKQIALDDKSAELTALAVKLNTKQAEVEKNHEKWNDWAVMSLEREWQQRQDELDRQIQETKEEEKYLQDLRKILNDRKEWIDKREKDYVYQMRLLQNEKENIEKRAINQSEAIKRLKRKITVLENA